MADENIVKAFEADGLVRQDCWNGVGALMNIRIADYEQHAFGRAFNQAASGFENRDAGAFGSNQGASDLETVFREKVIQVVAGDAARNLGKALANQIAVLRGDFL